MDLKEIKDLISFLEGTEFSEVEIHENDIKLRVVRQTAPPAPPPVQMVAPAPAQAGAQVPQAPVVPKAAGPYEVQIPPEPVPGKVIASPIVGTFYRRPSPDKPSYVEPGDTVKKGQVVCIVEAMKLMNEIESEFDGKVAAILVEDGEPVEFGQPLMRIES